MNRSSDQWTAPAISYSRGRDFAKQLFAYRTSLLVGRPREELRFAWDAARAACPE